MIRLPGCLSPRIVILSRLFRSRSEERSLWIARSSGASARQVQKLLDVGRLLLKSPRLTSVAFIFGSPATFARIFVIEYSKETV